MGNTNCIFCRIVAGDIPSTPVFSNDDAIVIRDLNPQAPTHLLVIPKMHYANATELARSDTNLFGRLMAVCAHVAHEEGLVNGYRLVLNTGPDGGQTVDHLHIHVLGGRHMRWPPG
jgi:histidine triad (HIT) family protein